MTELVHNAGLEKTIGAWLEKMHQDMYNECHTWKRYTDNAEKMSRFIEELEHGFTYNRLDKIYDAIGDYQTNAADVAYLIGVRHGMEAHIALCNGNIKDLLEKGAAK